VLPSLRLNLSYSRMKGFFVLFTLCLSSVIRRAPQRREESLLFFAFSPLLLFTKAEAASFIFLLSFPQTPFLVCSCTKGGRVAGRNMLNLDSNVGDLFISDSFSPVNERSFSTNGFGVGTFFRWLSFSSFSFSSMYVFPPLL